MSGGDDIPIRRKTSVCLSEYKYGQLSLTLYRNENGELFTKVTKIRRNNREIIDRVSVFLNNRELRQFHAWIMDLLAHWPDAAGRDTGASLLSKVMKELDEVK